MNAFFYSYPDDNYGINDGSPTGEDGDGEWEVPPNTDPDEKDRYLDNDGDGYHSAHIRTVELPSAYSGENWDRLTHGPDCDDGNPEITTECNNEKPCVSDDGKKANPLIDMKILPTPGDISARNGKPVNGDYGGRGGHHNGVDLAATPGTPIYASYDGKITGNIVTSWPDDMGGLDWNEFRDKRKEDGLDSNSGGNRFRLEVVVDGQMYHIQYMHLQEGGVIHSRNTEVKAGDIIGYTGATGSVQAPGSGGPHLHIEYWKNGQYKNYADPKDFFQSEFDEFGNTTNPCN
ncbi:M23 family metallopeptidase [Maribacter sp. 2304DJ31-5]|uniref:M23 family metallopeptidase n=1 Tax=Maribacter sp. 2304DJ31-5 TaxID=3386273 RepID=UPI0039BC779C